MKDSKNIFKKLGLIGIGLCVACCLLPIAAVMFGVGALTVISAYIEWVGVLAMLFAAVSFGIYYFRKRQAPACDIDCPSKEVGKISKS
jgi:hypothetical protein